MTSSLLASGNTAFAIVFSIFVVLTLVLLVLTIRFIVARGKADKAAFDENRVASAVDETSE